MHTMQKSAVCVDFLAVSMSHYEYEFHLYSLRHSNNCPVCTWILFVVKKCSKCLCLEDSCTMGFCSLCSILCFHFRRICLLVSLKVCLLPSLLVLKLLLNQFNVRSFLLVWLEKPCAWGFQSTCDVLWHEMSFSQESGNQQLTCFCLKLSCSFMNSCLLRMWKFSMRSACHREAGRMWKGQSWPSIAPTAKEYEQGKLPGIGGLERWIKVKN